MSDKEQLKSLLIQLLDKFVEVCEANGLRYYLAYGSALGAVRHQGLIPWDDDIDVVMPRVDYEKLYELDSSVWGDGYRLCSYRNTPQYVHDFMKVEDLNTTLIEVANPVYVGGVYIDIFPLDNVPNKEADDKMTKEASYYASRKWLFYSEPIPKKYLLKYLRYCAKRNVFIHNDEMRKWDELTKRYINVQSEYVKDYHCAYLHKAPLPMNVYGNGIKLLYEGKEYMAPQDYHTYLTHYYKNYMEYPPIEKRNSGHDWKYVNLSHRLTEDELKPIIKELTSAYHYSFSFSVEIRSIFDKICRLITQE